MTTGPDQMADGTGPVSVAALTARARGADARAAARLAGAVDDFFLAEDARLDDRSRLLLARVIAGVIAGVEADVRRHAARLLSARGAVSLAEAMLAPGPVADRLTRAGLLRDAELMEELLGRVRQGLITDSLPTAISGPDQPSLLVRLAELPDSIVAAAASALLVAEARRKNAGEAGITVSGDLPADLYHRLVWWVAAAVRAETGASVEGDRAIGQAAERALAAHDEGDQVESVAMRLAAAIDAQAEELAPLLIETLGDRRLSLFIAILAHHLGLDFAQARAVVLDPEGDRLWLALRAAGLDRPTIARIGLSLADADPARDLEAFADLLDTVVAVEPDVGRATLAPLLLPRDFRRAIDALERGR